jgi:molybdopterin molybdotransferase
VHILELFKVVTVDETKEILEEVFNQVVSSEIIDLKEALGRVIYKDIISDINVPSFRRSTVDGYAVAYKDVSGASESIPSIMDYKGDVVMGEAPEDSVSFPGECMYVPTGGMIPEGADSMVMIEYTDKLDEKTILINKPSAYGDHVVQIGEDIKKGEIVIKKGTKLRPYEIGVLSSLGISKVEVYKKPKVAVISTGDEIVGCEDTPAPGQVRDINSYLLYSCVLEDGGDPVDFGVIKDSFQALKEAVEKACNECDIILISGGSSVGKKDQTLKVINSLEDSKLLVHGISIKPGKPTIIAKAGDKAIFGLPGHPLSCALVYKVIVKYYLNSIINFSQRDFGVQCKFDLNYHKAKGREEYLPVTIEENEYGEMSAKPVFGKSGLITGFSKAWGYIKIDRNEEGIKEGQTVHVFKF